MIELLYIIPTSDICHKRGHYKCFCGNEFSARVDHVRSGCTKSCGCLRRNKAIKHGYSRSGKVRPEYNIWSSMIDRCINPNNKSYINYGGRGITVDDKWYSFDNFISDIGDRPTSLHSIDRIDVNQGYNKDNCRWATKYEQARNRTDNNNITYKGETKCVTDWTRDLNLTNGLISRRLRRGWSIERALETKIE